MWPKHYWLRICCNMPMEIPSGSTPSENTQVIWELRCCWRLCSPDFSARCSVISPWDIPSGLPLANGPSGDVLANLVVTPALFLWLTRAYVPLRPRLFEAIVWGIGFAFCLYFAVLSDQSVLAIYAPFPFLVWAALRLGTIGASSGLFLTTVLLIFGISRHKGPLFYPIVHDMHFLQLFLAILALPIMFVAILFEERQQAETRLLENQEELNQNYKRIRDLAGRLIRGQEEERSRIARELHDDITQQVAMLTVGLDHLESLPADKLALAHGELAQLRGKTEELGLAVRNVSRQLHSTVLQHLGLSKALKGLCRTFSQQHQIDVLWKPRTWTTWGTTAACACFGWPRRH